MQLDQLNRRELIALLGGATVAWPLAVRAQQPTTIPVVGWLTGRSLETDALVLPAFRRGLGALGFVEGQNMKVEYREAEGRYDRVPALVADLVRQRMAVLVMAGLDGDGMRTVQAASSTLPIVFMTSADPVKIGLVPNLNRPGGNITGVTSLYRQLGQKRLGLLHELLPRAAAFAILANPTNSSSAAELEDTLEGARSLGLRTETLNASTERELDAAFASLAQLRADALLVVTDPFFFTRANQIVALAARLSVPALYFRSEFAAAGGLISYGSKTEENYRALGDYAGRILKGDKPGDLPVQQSSQFELVLNLKAAKALGLAVPPTLLALADEVIE